MGSYSQTERRVQLPRILENVAWFCGRVVSVGGVDDWYLFSHGRTFRTARRNATIVCGKPVGGNVHSRYGRSEPTWELGGTGRKSHPDGDAKRLHAAASLPSYVTRGCNAVSDCVVAPYSRETFARASYIHMRIRETIYPGRRRPTGKEIGLLPVAPHPGRPGPSTMEC